MRSVASQGLVDQSLSRRLSRYLPLVIWMALIFFASTSGFSASNTSSVVRPILLWLFPDISAERLDLLHGLVRKAAHFFAYFILGILAARAFNSSSHKLVRGYWFRWSILLVVSYAFLDEYHQSFVPSRTGTIYDSFIDIAGGLVALVIYRAWSRRAASDGEDASV